MRKYTGSFWLRGKLQLTICVYKFLKLWPPLLLATEPRPAVLAAPGIDAVRSASAVGRVVCGAEVGMVCRQWEIVQQVWSRRLCPLIFLPAYDADQEEQSAKYDLNLLSLNHPGLPQPDQQLIQAHCNAIFRWGMCMQLRVLWVAALSPCAGKSERLRPTALHSTGYTRKSHNGYCQAQARNRNRKVRMSGE